LLHPNIDSLRIERNCIFYSSKGEVIGAKVFRLLVCRMLGENYQQKAC
jgi:hypothetical protein